MTGFPREGHIYICMYVVTKTKGLQFTVKLKIQKEKITLPLLPPSKPPQKPHFTPGRIIPK